jgi:very-short-patch-repair endonuclease
LTDAEQALWRHIRNRELYGYTFRRQTPIGKYIVDFVCLEKRLIVELDGGQHAVHQDEDNRRSKWLESQGFKVIRFWKKPVPNPFRFVSKTSWKDYPQRFSFAPREKRICLSKIEFQRILKQTALISTPIG